MWALRAKLSGLTLLLSQPPIIAHILDSNARYRCSTGSPCHCKMRLMDTLSHLGWSGASVIFNDARMLTDLAEPRLDSLALWRIQHNLRIGRPATNNRHACVIVQNSNKHIDGRSTLLMLSYAFSVATCTVPVLLLVAHVLAPSLGYRPYNKNIRHIRRQISCNSGKWQMHALGSCIMVLKLVMNIICAQ